VRPRLRAAALVLLGPLGARVAAATTYLPITDTDLVQRSAVVVRGTVADVRVEECAAGFVTVYRFRVADTWKGGSAPEIEILVPGGTDGTRGTAVWGVPEFRAGDEEILFLNAGRDGRFRVSELLLGAFEVVEDTAGKRFAMRTHIALGDVGYARTGRAGGEASDDTEPVEPARELDAFRAVVRAPASPAARAQLVVASRTVTGTLLPRRQGRRSPDWVLVAPPKQMRFNWNPGGQAAASIGYTPGGQANLSDGSDGISHITTAAGLWTGVPGADIRLAAPAAGTSGVTIVVNLNAAVDPFAGYWTTPLCGGGVLGVASSHYSGTHSWAGGTWFTAVSGNVWMRAYSCSTPVSWFANVVPHELGHVIGFGHSDVAVDARDTDTTNNCLATMKSCLGPCGTAPCDKVDNLRFPVTLGADDMEAARFVYQAPVAPPPAVSAATGFSAVPPCRVLDTRNAAGPLGAPALGALASRSFAVTGACGVPSGAVAISANVTVVNPAAAGELVAYPNGLGAPGTSTISFRASRTRANNALLYLASDGSFLVTNRAAGTLDLVVDVNGYFQ
jgi:hypothetical protein